MVLKSYFAWPVPGSSRGIPKVAKDLLTMLAPQALAPCG